MRKIVQECQAEPKDVKPKLRIVRAIVDLGDAIPFSKMTVRDICEKAEISRQTFYRHFKDKYDALNWYDRRLNQDVSQLIGSNMTWEDLGRTVLLNAYTERKFYVLCLRSAEDHNSLLPSVIRFYYNEWRKVLSSLPGFTITDEIDFQLKAWSRAGAEMAAEWILGGCEMPVDEMAALMTSCVPKRLREEVDCRIAGCRAQN